MGCFLSDVFALCDCWAEFPWFSVAGVVLMDWCVCALAAQACSVGQEVTNLSQIVKGKGKFGKSQGKTSKGGARQEEKGNVKTSGDEGQPTLDTGLRARASCAVPLACCVRVVISSPVESPHKYSYGTDESLNLDVLFAGLSSQELAAQQRLLKLFLPSPTAVSTLVGQQQDHETVSKKKSQQLFDGHSLSLTLLFVGVLLPFSCC